MSCVESGCGGVWPVVCPSVLPDLRTNSFRFRITDSTSSFPAMWRVFTPAISSSPTSFASASQVRGSRPSPRSEPRFDLLCAIEAFAFATCARGCS